MVDRTVNYRFTASFADFQSKVTAAQRSVKGFGDDLMGLDKRGEQMRRGLTDLGNTAGKFGLAAAGGLTFAAKAAIDWETAWTGVLKTVDGSPAELAKLEDGLRGLATETGFAHAEVAAVAEAAGQLGISTGGVEKFTRTMLDMGVSTSLSSEEAAVGLAQLRNIMGFTEEEIRNTGSAMVALGNNFATNESKILAMSQRIAGAGRQAGLSTPDVLGLSTAMSEVGIEAEAGGTAMSLTMKRIGKEVETGGEKLALFARTAGMSQEEFTQAWGSNAAETLTKFIDGLSRAEETGSSTNAVLRELGVTGIREADALLRLSGNAEGVARALDAASEGFEENSALAEEAGKFYDTTGQQIKQAWADIKDSAIDAGEVLLPVIAKTAESVAGLSQAFSDLPGPVKSSVTGLLGLTAIFGGSLWFTSKVINGVVGMRVALADLGVQAPRTAGGLRGVAGAAGRLFVLAAALTAVEKAVRGLNDPRVSGADLGRNIEAIAGGVDHDDLDRFANSIKEINNQSGRLSSTGEKVLDFGQTLVTLGMAGDTNLDVAQENIRQLDQQLAVLVESGNAEQAQAALERIAGAAQGLDSPVNPALRWVEEFFPSYNTAVQNAANVTEDAGGAAEEFGSAIAGSGTDAMGAADDVEEYTKAVNEAAEAALSAFGATTNWRQALKSARAQAKENSAGLQGMSEAVLGNRVELESLAGALNKQVELGAVNEKQWKAQRREFIAVAESMGVPKARAKELANELLAIPKDIKPRVGLDVDEGSFDAVERRLTNLVRTRFATIRVNEVRTGTGGAHLERADGGTIPGPRHPYGDSVPALLAPTEFVVSNRHGQVDRNRGLLEAINSNRLADGGMADGGRVSVSDILTFAASGKLQKKVDRLDIGFGRLEKALAKSEKALSAEVQQRDEVRSQMRSLSGSVRGRLRSDLFGGETDGFGSDFAAGSFGDVIGTLQGDIRQGRAFKQATRTLRGKGLGGSALEALLAEGDPVAFANLSRQQLQQYERLFERRQRVTASAGHAAGQAAFGDEMKQAVREFKGANKRLDRIEKVIEREHKEDRQAARRGAGRAARGRR